MAHKTLKDLSEKPIKIPGNPFWNVFKRFGRDELIALIINAIGTIIAKALFSSTIVLAVAGPVIEKIGFFPAHFKEAWDVYRTTNKKQRKKLPYYLKKAMKGRTKSLVEDILIHDPIYIVLMYIGLKIYSTTPVWILSIISFIIAVFVVSGVEVGIVELAYLKLKRKLKKQGFQVEKYLESRFLIKSNKSPKQIIDRLSKKFNLKDHFELYYDDTYLENQFKKYSGRKPKVRLRKRTKENKGFMKTLQVVYTRAIESNKKKYEQYRYFPIKKEKIYYVFNQKMPIIIEDIKDPKIRSTLKKSKTKKAEKKIKFKRIYARNKDLLVSVDEIAKKRDFHVMELKTHSNLKLLIKAMRYTMREFPVIQTTHNKYDINSDQIN